MSEDDDKVTKLNVKFKSRDPDRPMLEVVRTRIGECDHDSHYVDGRLVDVTYIIRDGETEVECGNCGVRLDPMFVLKKLAREETRFEDSRQRYNDEMRRLSERSRTKCEHCGKMTRISRS